MRENALAEVALDEHTDAEATLEQATRFQQLNDKVAAEENVLRRQEGVQATRAADERFADVARVDRDEHRAQRAER